MHYGAALADKHVALYNGIFQAVTPLAGPCVVLQFIAEMLLFS